MKKKCFAVIPAMFFLFGMTAAAAPPAASLDVSTAAVSVNESTTDQIISQGTTFSITDFEVGDKITYNNQELTNGGTLPEENSQYSYLNAITGVDRGSYTEYIVDAVPVYTVSFQVDPAYAMPVETMYYAKGTSMILPSVSILNDSNATFLGWCDSSGNTCPSTLVADSDMILNACFSVPGDLRQVQAPKVNPFENGTSLADILSALPWNATIYLDNSSQCQALVSWQADSVAYDPSSATQQELTIEGTVKLPDNVTNTQNIDLTVSVPVTVYGRDTQMYTLSYDLNGAPGNAPGSAQYEENERVSLPADPTWYHHLFMGWSTKPDSSYANTGKNALTMPSKDTTLYAIWQEDTQYTLTFDANGGSGSVPSSLTVYADEVATLPFQVALKKASSVFAGWSPDETAESPTYTSAKNTSLYLTQDTTLYATYEDLADVTVSYDANGGTGTLPEDHAVYHAGDQVTVRFSGISKEHCSFLGWSTDPFAYLPDYATGSSTTFLMPNHNVTLYAVWRSNEQFTVTYHANGGTGALPLDNHSYYTGDTVNVLFAPAPTKEHAVFAGWSASPDALSASFIASQTTSFQIGSSNVDLYAVWEEDPHMQIRYSAGESEKAPVDDTHYYDGQMVTVKFTPAPSCYGKNFLGWSDDPQATVPDYTQNGSKTFTVSLNGKGSIKVLYAVWETEAPKHITYDFNNVTLTGSFPSDSTDYYTGDIIYLDFNVTPKDPLFSFLGWAKTKDAYEPYYTSDNIKSITMATEDITLYAVYKKTTDIDGEAQISFTPGTGVLRANYTQGRKVADSLSYDWLLDGEKVASGSTYTPTKAGVYSVLVSDATSKYTGCVKSDSISLHQVSSTQKISLDTVNGLYEKGNLVTATATLGATNTVFSRWSADGVTLAADKETKNPLSFTMPDKDVVLSFKTEQLFSIRVSGGVASTYSAKAGESISLTASKVGGRVFEKWVPSGLVSLSDPTSEKTSFVMPAANVTISAVFRSEADTLNRQSGTTRQNSSSSASSQNRNTSGKTGKNAISADTESNGDPIVYTVLSDGNVNNANIKVTHHSQGPLCEVAFKLALGKWSMYTDYYNITVKDAQPPVYDTEGKVKIQLSIPSDLRKSGRRFKMICVSRFGIPYTFDDLDTSDSTITFEADRFYAYALCFSDDADVTETTQPQQEADIVETSQVHSAEESATATDNMETSLVRSASESQTGDVMLDVIGYTSVSMPTAVENGVDTLVRYNAM